MKLIDKPVTLGEIIERDINRLKNKGMTVVSFLLIEAIACLYLAEYVG